MQSALTKIFLAIIGLALFVAINRSAGPKVSELQSAYESWLQGYQDATINSLEQHNKPVVKISLISNYPENQNNWQIISNSSPQSSDKVLRLLQLAKEAKFFADRPIVSSDTSWISVDIEEGSHKFSANFGSKFLEQNVAALGFTKLFETYYNELGLKINPITKQ